MTRFLLRLSFLAAVLVAVGCSAAPSTPPGEPDKDGPKPLSTPRAPDFTMTAVDLAKEFEADKDAAEKKYKDKIVEIDAVAGDPTDRGLDVTMVVATYRSDPKKVVGRMVIGSFNKPEKEKVLALTPGQTIKMTGKVGGDFAGNVSLTDCVVVKAGPDPSIHVSAADLTKAFSTDEKAAKEKYEDKQVVVEGVVIEIKKGGIVDSLILEGFDEKSAKPVRVAAGVPVDNKAAFAALKKGEKVKLKGQLSGYYPEGAGYIVNINGTRLVK